MAGSVQRFLGDSPLRVALKLIIISFIVGVFMHYFGVTPLEVIDRFVGMIEWAWQNGYEALASFASYFIIGAVVVVPIFLIVRLMSYRRGS
ncbi:hypothetical protein B7H23_01500 [Notoacmeibacter marinus]|uniref:DUF6460 domain-containing protein n=1 Tax=Notoacmeibacter marinus TaxID=1876515 RepID=A0A231V0E4_9HYPH|nr:DUF6460 domain-containing protein [Notoacmeibacter marinus]OXT01668.1 hypothetical protein B7H23_01500 [Notoacmeibacter marinus]